MKEVIAYLKYHLNLPHLRVALPNSELPLKLSNFAFCPGAGASIFRHTNIGKKKVQCLITGEMSHHEMIFHQEHGRVVVLLEHSNSERGYLPLLKNHIEKSFPSIHCYLSEFDKDPVQYF